MDWVADSDVRAHSEAHVNSVGFLDSMIFAFLDEFGHSGPYVSRTDKRYNTSPVFGLAGFLMPQDRVRSFGSCYLQLKQSYLSADPTRNGKPFYEWEKKGTNFLTSSSITRYPSIKNCMFRVINEINKRDGKLIYQGREKIRGKIDGLNSNGLYTTVFADTIRQIDQYCETIGENFVIVLDQHSARQKLLVTASKTMYGNKPTRRMICPPFEVESHINQHIQTADWIATVVGRIWNYRLESQSFSDMKNYDKYFGNRIEQLSIGSGIKKRRPPRAARPSASIDNVFSEAFRAAGMI